MTPLMYLFPFCLPALPLCCSAPHTPFIRSQRPLTPLWPRSAVKLGKKHPDPVVETASLASVAPTDVWYKLSLPEDVINMGKLSALQLEAITYACQAHSQFLKDGCRAGFLIGGWQMVLGGRSDGWNLRRWLQKGQTWQKGHWAGTEPVSFLFVFCFCFCFV